MAKSAVNDIVDKVQRRADYFPATPDSDLDTLTIDILNDAIKLVYQSLFEVGNFLVIGQSATLSTTASQAYIDISTTLAAMDKLIKVSERTNDHPIEIIPYTDFINLYTDPSASSAQTPDHCSIWNERLYLGPTPSTSSISIYAEYVGVPNDVSAGNTMPYKTKYDPLIIAIGVLELVTWLNPERVTTISAATKKVDTLMDKLIINAPRDFINRQTQSRKDSVLLGPRKPETTA